MTLEISPVDSADAAGLRYVSDDEAGYRRVRRGTGFAYYDPDGEHVQDDALKARFEALAIPPAWSEVWICKHANGHLQATGRDEAGRKQYRYHSDWREVRDQAKFDQLVPFAEALPALRRRVRRDARRDGLPRRRVVAAVVKLLDSTLIRVGNDEYARENDSYGATTLLERHVDLDGDTLTLAFRGKHGKEQEIVLDDARLAEIVRDCSELPGQRLFSYLDDDGDACPVDSADVNDYLRDTTEHSFTAKDFRTWAGTVLALAELRDCDPPESERDRDGSIGRVLERVAARLGNTPAVCRDSYIHPGLFELHRAGELPARVEAALGGSEVPRGLRVDEGAALALLRALRTDAS